LTSADEREQLWATTTTTTLTVVASVAYLKFR